MSRRNRPPRVVQIHIVGDDGRPRKICDAEWANRLPIEGEWFRLFDHAERPRLFAVLAVAHELNGHASLYLSERPSLEEALAQRRKFV